MKSFLIFFFLFLSAIVTNAQTIDFTATQACFGNQTTLKGSSSLKDADIASWNWDFNNDGDYSDASGKLILWVFDAADTFSVGLKIIKIAGDSMMKINSVIVHPLPVVDFKGDNLCELKTATFIDQSKIESGTIKNYYWDFDNNGKIDDNSNDTVRFNCGPAQTYITKLKCVSDKGCEAFATHTTTVYNQPKADYEVEKTCRGDNTLFIDKTTFKNEKILFSIWNFGDGEHSISQGNQEHQYKQIHIMIEPFPYDVPYYKTSLIVMSENNCRDTANVDVTINPLPKISLKLSGDAVFLKGKEVTISVEGNVKDYLWDKNKEITSSIKVTESGTYSVTATDDKGCKATADTTIAVKDPETSLIFKNDILTPNGDGINDYFEIENIGLYTDCELAIYNIWNDLVYSIKNYKNDWNGASLDAGAYYFILKYKDKTEKGNINILR